MAESEAKVNDLPKPHWKWPLISDETRAAVLSQLDKSISVYQSTGVIAEFEDNFIKYHGDGGLQALLFNSGTSAILAMMVGIGLQPGDEVIAPTYTFFATASPLLVLHARPIFADSRPDGNIDPEEIRKKITPLTKAVIITHTWGLPCDMDEIVSICREHDLKLLEDCSQAHGATYKGQIVGTFGDAAAWSLQGRKIVTGGQGGIMLTKDINVYSRAQFLGGFDKCCVAQISESNPMYPSSLIGFGLNHRIHPLAAAIANQQFGHLDEWLAQKREYAGQIIKVLEEFVPFLKPPVFKDKEPAWYAFVMQFQAKACKVTLDEFLERMHALGLDEIDRLKEMLTGPIHTLPMFAYDPSGRHRPVVDSFPLAQAFYENAVKLPVWVTSSVSVIVKAYIRGLKEVAEDIAIFE